MVVLYIWGQNMKKSEFFKFAVDKTAKVGKFILVMLFIFGLALFSGCKKENNGKKKFVTSCYPVYIMALNLADGVDDVEILRMSESHSGCLHDFQLQSEDLKRIEKSSAFIINGAGMESFLDKVVKELPNVKIIDSSNGIEFIKDEECGHGHDEVCEHEYNPHIWLSVDNYIKQIENIEIGLSKIDSASSVKYHENAEKYIKRLNNLKNEMHSRLGNISGKNIITFHEAFPYFAKEFNLNIISVVNSQPGSGPSAKEISEVTEKIKKYNIKALFTEPQYSDSSAKIISSETGAKVYTLDPVVTGNGDKDDYINKMRKNMEVLEEALK